MTKPFEGVRILDFTRVVAGRFATHQLWVLGSDAPIMQLLQRTDRQGEAE